MLTIAIVIAAQIFLAEPWTADDAKAKAVRATRQRTTDQAWGLRMYDKWKAAEQSVAAERNIRKGADEEIRRLQAEVSRLTAQLKTLQQPTTAPARAKPPTDDLDFTGSRQIGGGSSYKSSGGGRISVGGYRRKDGTYVRPHTRRRPSR